MNGPQPFQQRAPEAGSYLGPGVWVDTDGALHLSVPEILTHLGIEVTQESVDEWTPKIAALIARDLPEAELVVRQAPPVS